MSVKIIGLIKVLDATAFDRYRAQVGATIALYKGQILLRGRVLATEWNELRCEEFDAVVELSFPSRDDAQAWVTSPEYLKLLEIRSKAMRLTLISVERVG